VKFLRRLEWVEGKGNKRQRKKKRKADREIGKDKMGEECRGVGGGTENQ